LGINQKVSSPPTKQDSSQVVQSHEETPGMF